MLILESSMLLLCLLLSYCPQIWMAAGHGRSRERDDGDNVACFWPKNLLALLGVKAEA